MIFLYSYPHGCPSGKRGEPGLNHKLKHTDFLLPRVLKHLGLPTNCVSCAFRIYPESLCPMKNWGMGVSLIIKKLFYLAKENSHILVFSVFCQTR